MKACEVCQVLAGKNNGQDSIILETERWLVVLDNNQRFLGKMFVTLREHKQTLSQLNQEDWREFEMIVGMLEKAVKKVFNSSHFNWSCLMNIAAMEGQETHVHWHVHPRYSEKIEINSEIFEDGQWYPRKEKIDHFVAKDTKQIIVRKIKKELND